MEKGKKVKKEVKEKKVVKKEEVKKEVLKDDGPVIMLKHEKNLVKFAALLSAFFASGLAILMFIFSVVACISIFNLPNEELVNNNIVVTLVSKLNNYSALEVKDMIINMSNNLSFVLFEIIIPAIAFIGSLILVIVLAKRLIEFVNDITYEKDLYNKKKLSRAQDIISILSIVLLTMLVIFDKPSIILYLLIEVLLCIIYLLFKKCVSLRKR